MTQKSRNTENTTSQNKEESERLDGYVEKIRREDFSEEQLSYNEKTEMINVPDSPMVVIREGYEWFVVLGKYRLTRALESKEAALKDAERTDWSRTIQVVEIIMKSFKD